MAAHLCKQAAWVLIFPWVRMHPPAGVMACVIYGLTGAASMNWHMSLKAKRSASMQHFWDVLTFAMNVSSGCALACSCPSSLLEDSLLCRDLCVPTLMDPGRGRWRICRMILGAQLC